MKNLLYIALVSVAPLISLETPQTAATNYETKSLENAVLALKTEQKLGQKLLGKNPNKVADLATKLKKQLYEMKAKKVNLSQKDLTELVDKAIDSANQLEAETYKLK